MSDPIPPQPESPTAGPRDASRLPNRILLAGLGLSFAFTVLQVARDSDLLFSGLIAMALFGLLLTLLPSALFLFYSWRQPPPVVDRNMKVAIYFTGALLAFGGAVYALAGREDGSFLVVAIGVAIALLGVTAIVRLFVFTAPAASTLKLGYGNGSGLGVLAFLIVVVVLPKFACGCGNKDKAYQAALKSDLRNLVTAEEAYFADRLRYGSRADLGNGFMAWSYDSILVVPVDTQGFSAIGTNVNLPGVKCGIWSGVRPADGMHGAVEGEPKCWKEE